MFWTDKIEQELGNNEIINDSKTPSGRVHVGSLRGVVLHYMIYKVLSEAGKNPTYYYGTDDFDPMDGLAEELKKDFKQYMGMPLYKIPSPGGNEGESFADYYMKEYIGVFHSLNIHPTIYKMSDFYTSGKMNETIETILNNVDKIREIYLSVSGSKKPDTWHPFQVICERCGKLGTTLVHSFDGKEVEYTCEPSMVKWAKGCKHRGKMSPFDGNGKLPWKLEWVGKWKTLGVTVEGAGKDHSSDGGARDVSSEIFRSVMNGKPPYNIPYEFFLTGKKKMSSSKGLGSSSKDIADLIPPELLRFLMVRYPPNAVIDFNPMGDTIPRLFDEYDRCGNLFFNKEEDKSESLERAFELAQVDEKGYKERFFPRFSLLSTLIQIPSVSLEEKVKEMKKDTLTDEDLSEIDLRKIYAKKWLDNCANEANKFEILEQLPEGVKDELSEDQLKFVNALFPIFDQEGLSGEEIHQMIYETTQKVEIKPAEGFKTIYLMFIGKKQGPKVGTLLAALDKKFIKERLNQVIS